jgi:hypothetical protein
MPIAMESLLLLAERNNSTRQVADQTLLDRLDIVRPCISAAAKSRVYAVDDFALGDLLRDDLAAYFDGFDGRGRELDRCQVPRNCHYVGDG